MKLSKYCTRKLSFVKALSEGLENSDKVIIVDG